MCALHGHLAKMDMMRRFVLQAEVSGVSAHLKTMASPLPVSFCCPLTCSVSLSLLTCQVLIALQLHILHDRA